MIPTTFTLLIAATLSVNAAPIFSGFFAAPAAAPAVIQKRDLTGTEFAQGTNFLFKSLLLESECSPGQVACINNNTATCAPEGNWEITPCTGGSSCLAVPASSDPTDTSLVVKCMSQDTAFSALGTQDLAVDFQITTAPVNTTVSDLPDNSDPSDTPSDSISSTSDVATTTLVFGTDPTSTDSAVPTCTPDDGDEDPTEDPTDSIPEFSQTLGGEVPTPTDDVPTDTATDSPTATSSDDSTATCTEDPAEPTETEYITVIAIPEQDGQFSYSTVLPTSTDAETVSEAVPTSTNAVPVDEQPTPTDSTSDSVPTSDPTGSDADLPPTDSESSSVECTETPTETDSYVEPTDSSSDPAPTDSPTDSSSSSSDDSITSTTLATPPENVVPTPSNTPDVNPLGTHSIPASSSAPSSPTDNAPIPIRKRMIRRRV